MALSSLPSQREKKMYVVFKVHSQGALQYHMVRAAVPDALLDFLGERGTAAARARLVKNLWNARERTGFLQTTPKAVDPVKVALALIHQIGEERVAFQTLRVSGTIKAGKGALGRKR